MAEHFVPVPDIGSDSAEVLEINVAAGDLIEEGDTVVTLESDKATIEVPAPEGGRVAAVCVALKEMVSTGQNMLQMQAVENSGAPAQEKSPAQQEPPAAVSSGATSSGAVDQVALKTEQVPDNIGSEKVAAIEVNVSVGDRVESGDCLVTLESDKASIEVPATCDGTVTQVHVSVGDALGAGDAVVTLEVQAASMPAAQPQPEPAAAPVATAAAPTAPAAQPSTPAVPAPASSPVAASTTKTSVHAGPAVRLMARELGVDLSQVPGSGLKGRILKEDVQAHIKTRLNAAPAAGGAAASVMPPAAEEIDFSQWGDVDVQPLGRLQELAAKNFQRSWLQIPHVTHNDEADITELEAFRKASKAEAEAHDVRLTPLPFLLKACAKALQQMPEFCASLSADGRSRIFKKYIHIGVAVDTPNGLLVPVIRDVDKKGLFELAEECVTLAGLARKKQLKPDQMKGGCFTLSSLGALGGTSFTPIVNAPEVAILGIAKAAMKPFWNGQSFEPRLMLPLSLSYDHRAVNGAQAARFTALLASFLTDIRKLLL